MDVPKEDNVETGYGGVTSSPIPKKRGRPRKNSSAFGEGGEREGTGGQMVIRRSSNGKVRKRKRMKDNDGAGTGATTDIAHVGQQVHGVVDGSFDAGYFLTVRVGGSQTVLRGVVFEPTLSAPVAKGNDIAPNVVYHKRQEHLITTPTQGASYFNSNSSPRSEPPLVSSATFSPMKDLVSKEPKSQGNLITNPTQGISYFGSNSTLRSEPPLVSSSAFSPAFASKDLVSKEPKSQEHLITNPTQGVSYFNSNSALRTEHVSSSAFSPPFATISKEAKSLPESFAHLGAGQMGLGSKTPTSIALSPLAQEHSLQWKGTGPQKKP